MKKLAENGKLPHRARGERGRQNWRVAGSSVGWDGCCVLSPDVLRCQSTPRRRQLEAALAEANRASGDNETACTGCFMSAFGGNERARSPERSSRVAFF